jgi:hypothetical protein
VSSAAAVPTPSERPNLEQKRVLARELLRGVRNREERAALRFTWNAPRFRGRTAVDVLRAPLKLADAQQVIARESGFDSWPKLKQYLQLLDADPQGPAALFEAAVRCIIQGDLPELSRLLHQHPELATMRSARSHRAVLLHYIAANGVEGEHQKTPPNAVQVTELLFAAGAAAVVDATAGFYGGGGGSTPLVGLVTSCHPAQAGLQGELVQRFCRAGACVNGIDDDGLPLASALAFRYPEAARALRDCGARVDNLVFAAALGEIELLQRLLDAGPPYPNAMAPVHPDFRAVASERVPELALVFAGMCGELGAAALLVSGRVDINGGPFHRQTALHEACYQGNLEMVRFLLSRGADPTLRDAEWNATAVGWAAEGKHAAVVDALFAHGRVDFLDAVAQGRHDLARAMLREAPALANAPDGTGAALRTAIAKGDAEMAQLLLQSGADPHLRNAAGLSAADLARRAGWPEPIPLTE